MTNLYGINIDDIYIGIYRDKNIEVNSADPDEMPPYAAFHLGLHCLPNLLTGGLIGNNLS